MSELKEGDVVEAAALDALGNLSNPVGELGLQIQRIHLKCKVIEPRSMRLDSSATRGQR